MAGELEKRGNMLFVGEDYEEALECYSQAISLDSSNPSLYISRASAHSKLGNWTEAVADADRAIELDPSLHKAYLRKGVAYFEMEKYQTAKSAFLAGASRDPVGQTFKSWIHKCDCKLKENGPTLHADDARAGSSSETNGIQAGPEIPTTRAQIVSIPDQDDTPMSSTVVSAPVQPKYRHEWYQAQTHVVVTIFAKGVKGDQVKIDFGDQTLSVVIQELDVEPYVLQIRVYGKIKASECSYKLLGTKLEIRLVKAEQLTWKSLEYDKRQDVVQPTKTHEPAPQKVYPSSSKRPSKNWDKLEAEVKKEEKDEKLEGDAALNKLFREIYQNADEDTRRAMNKSFVESSGTVLSTNWKEIGSKPVEGTPPKGMEMKKWEL